MPKERKKRGRREARARLSHAKESDSGPAQQGGKRFKRDDGRAKARESHPREVEDGDSWEARRALSEQNGQNGEQEPLGLGELPFYGLLDESEQEYFKQADSLLELNNFEEDEERQIFLANLHRELNGKELKVANSQSCSRLLERLIGLSSRSQVESLCKTFQGHFLNLAQHRFASHCCEALFLKALPFVAEEVEGADNTDREAGTSMEESIVSIAHEFRPHLGYVLTHPFASHVLRVLLVVLSGLELHSRADIASFGSKRKEYNAMHSSPGQAQAERSSCAVPESFHRVLADMICDPFAGLETAQVRSLATHPVANPVMQLVLELELKKSSFQPAPKPSSLLQKLLPDAGWKDNGAGQNPAFVRHLLYDPVGSRLLEVVLANAPGKAFKRIYQAVFKDNLHSIARNEVASFSLVKVLERLSGEELEVASTDICRDLTKLLDRSRVNVLKVLIERSRVRGLGGASIAQALEEQLGAAKLADYLHFNAPPPAQHQTEDGDARTTASAARTHAALLAQTMLSGADELRDRVQSALLTLSTAEQLARAATDQAISRVIQAALQPPPSSSSAASDSSSNHVIFLRRFIPAFLLLLPAPPSHHHDEATDDVQQVPLVAALALDPTGSHVVDALAPSTRTTLPFLHKRLADALRAHEGRLRESPPGRAVVRNWRLNTYSSSRHYDQNGNENGEGKEKGKEKTKLELARERHSKIKHKHDIQAKARARAGKQQGV